MIACCPACSCCDCSLVHVRRSIAAGRSGGLRCTTCFGLASAACGGLSGHLWCELSPIVRLVVMHASVQTIGYCIVRDCSLVHVRRSIAARHSDLIFCSSQPTRLMASVSGQCWPSGWYVLRYMCVSYVDLAGPLPFRLLTFRLACVP